MTQVKAGTRTYTLLVPVKAAGAKLAQVRFRPWTYGDTRLWEAGEIDGEHGVINELWLRLTGLTMAHLDAIQYPDADLMMREFAMQIPQTVMDAIRNGELPEPSPRVLAARELAAEQEVFPGAPVLYPGETAAPAPSGTPVGATWDFSTMKGTAPEHSAEDPWRPEVPSEGEKLAQAAAAMQGGANPPGTGERPSTGRGVAREARTHDGEPIYAAPEGFMPTPMSDEDLEARRRQQPADFGIDLYGDDRART